MNNMSELVQHVAIELSEEENIRLRKRVNELESFISEFIGRWEDGTAGDSSIYNYARRVMNV